MLDEKTKARLIREARRVMKNSYSPYSGFSVGAAVLCADGKIYTGANFENASFGAGSCAERVALGSALSDGERKFSALAVASSSGRVMPCGICRQALSEFGDMDVVLDDGSVMRLSELLPSAFTEF